MKNSSNKVKRNISTAKKNIVLIGFMGSGKSAVGKYLADSIGFSFLDMDKYIESNSNMTIPQIFSEFGEEEFRRLESEAASYTGGLSRHVIATGGGVIKNEKNIESLKSNAVIVYLNADSEHIFNNLQGDDSRPLLQGGDKLSNIRNVLSERVHLYEMYSMVKIDVSGRSIEDIATSIINECFDY